MAELRGLYEEAFAAEIADPDQTPPIFGFGFGTDTNGLSAQSGPRNSDQIAEAGAIVYPYRLFEGGVFNSLTDMFASATAVDFEQPSNADPDGNGRTWHLDLDGSAHHGMLSGFVQEMNLHGTPQDMRDLFNSAEAFLQTWERTEASQAGILANGNGGLTVVPDGVLRAAPVPEGGGLPFP